MAETVKALLITDLEGNVLAAELGPEAESPRQDQETPNASLAPSAGQRAVTIDIPAQALNLSGPGLHQYFSAVKFKWPADVQLPNIEDIGKAGPPADKQG